MSYKNTKYITKKLSKVKVVDCIKSYPHDDMGLVYDSFVIRIEGNLYFVDGVFSFDSIQVAYDILNAQDKYGMSIYSFDEIIEKYKSIDEIMSESAIERIVRQYNAITSHSRESKIKKLLND